MPVEPTKAKLKRRSSRKEFDEYRFDGTHARELELKRNRGEVSCAECRRLKIKCDKQIPCQSCQRRGCAALCPNGSLSTGQGTRFVLAATEHLHKRISRLSGRIRQLEDALAALHGQHSSEPHPLLHEDLIVHEEVDDNGLIGSGDDGPGAGGVVGVPGGASDAIDAFGTLSISDHGISRFFGPTGGSESLLISNLNSHSPGTPQTPDSLREPSPGSHSGPNTNTSNSTSSNLSLFSNSFPFTPLGPPPDVQNLIATHLPPFQIARSLCDTYFAQVSWLFRGVTRGQLIEDMLPAIYHVQGGAGREDVHAETFGPEHAQGEDYSGPHDLALLFMIFAIGALVMPEEPDASHASKMIGNPTNARNALGEHYHQVARAALALQPVLEKPSIVTIQTLHLMSIYNAMSGSDLKNETSMEMTWSLITLAGHLSMTIGLHRDSARWGLSPKMVQRRRILFWDLFVADVWQSLNTGRPPSFSLAYIDCSFPQPEGTATGDMGNGGEEEGGFGSAFGIWQCRFAAECVAEVTARTLTAEAPSYATIMDLDRKVREFPLPEGHLGAASDDMTISFQRCVLDHIRETVLMYIHRSFFAQAMIEHPINPLKSPYAPSFLAAYRASSTILKSVREQFNIWPNSSSRFWTMWTFAFSAAVVFGTVVTRGPRSPLAQSAMSELEQACVLFSKAAVHSIRATKALPILLKLSEKARHALAAAQKDPSPLSGDNGGLLWNIKQEDTDDELSIFAGHTRFVSAKGLTPHHGAKPLPRASRAPHVPMSRQDSMDTSYTEFTTVPQTQQMVSSWDPPLDVRSVPVTLPTLDESKSHQNYYYLLSERTNSFDPLYGSWTGENHREPPPPVQVLSHNYRTPGISASSHFSTKNISRYSRASLPRHQSQHQPPQRHPPTHQTLPHQLYSHPQYHMQLPLEHLHHQQNVSHPTQQQQHYDTTPAFQSHGPLPNAELADLGLAARDSRLDERWSSFMEDSGILDGVGFRAH